MEEFTFPLEFEKRAREQVGSTWDEFFDVHTKPSPVSIRLNRRKVGEDVLSMLTGNTDYKKIAWADNGYYLGARPSFTLDPVFHAGAYYVQEASSMLLEQAVRQTLDGAENQRVLDLCAAPGGKSTHLLSLITESSLLVSNEVIRSRASVLAENILKWGYSNTLVTNSDPEDFQRLKGYFDLIVVDAPCSGEGLFRKDRQAMNEWSVENANLCSSRQQRIVHDVWPALKENGVLIYCTCTYNPEENQENIKRLLTEHEAEIIPLQLEDSWGVRQLDIGYQCFPHQMKGEGFYLAVIRKKEAQSVVRLHNSKPVFSRPTKVNTPYQQWLTDPSLGYVQFKDFILTAPEHLLKEMEFISAQFKIITAGTTIGTIKHSKVIPDHGLAMSIHLSKETIPVVSVTKEEAITYLRKDIFWREGLTKGFSIIEYEGVSLGLVNVLDNRLNNLYPSEWRIRMKNLD